MRCRHALAVIFRDFPPPGAGFFNLRAPSLTRSADMNSRLPTPTPRLLDDIKIIIVYNGFLSWERISRFAVWGKPGFRGGFNRKGDAKSMNWLKLGNRKVFLAIELGLVVTLAGTLAGRANNSQPLGTPGQAYSIHGLFVEGCSCPTPCAHDLIGTPETCKKIGFIQIYSGAWQNSDLSGARIAYVLIPGHGVKLFVDGRDRDQKAAAASFAGTALREYGEVRHVLECKVEIFGKGGDFLVTVEGGNILQLETEPVLGGDGRNPIMYSNTQNRLVPTLYQGRTRQGLYNDGEDTFKMAGSNAFFNEDLLSTGQL